MNEEFEKWVKKNYTGKSMIDPPKNLDPSKEVYIGLDGKHYGPVKIEDIPEDFK